MHAAGARPVDRKTLLPCVQVPDLQISTWLVGPMVRPVGMALLSGGDPAPELLRVRRGL